MADSKVNILLLGSGGREHALLSKLAASPRAGKLWVAPGNAGMLSCAQQVPISDTNPDEVAAFALKNNIDLVVVGPEAPLVAGVADAVRAAGIACFGPNRAAAQIEGSKEFAKRVMDRAGAPTAKWRAFTEEDACCAYVRELAGPCVVKADGLAAGKGVVVAATTQEALDAVHNCFAGEFGDAGTRVVIEEMLSGPECSLLALSDGTTLVPLALSQDHKRALDGDAGANTGGMGAYSPVPSIAKEDFERMLAIEQRVIDQLAADGTPYSGCLYGGFMLTDEGPKVLEFNARFGDPETQVVLPRMQADLIEVFLACDSGNLSSVDIAWDEKCAVTVVLTSQGYPGPYEVGKAISGIEQAQALSGVEVFHAGTKLSPDKQVLTSGGRVLAVTALAHTFEEARTLSYQACDLIQFEGKTLRSDIGMRAIQPNNA